MIYLIIQVYAYLPILIEEYLNSNTMNAKQMVSLS